MGVLTAEDQEKADLAYLGQLLLDVAAGSGFSTMIRGVKIEKCDEYGYTPQERLSAQLGHDAETLEREYEALEARISNALEYLGSVNCTALPFRALSHLEDILKGQSL